MTTTPTERNNVINAILKLMKLVVLTYLGLMLMFLGLIAFINISLALMS